MRAFFFKKFGLALSIAGAHLFLTICALLFSFGGSMSRFETGQSPSPVDSVVDAVFEVLSFPVIPLVKVVPLKFPGLWGYIPFILNSLLWAITGLAAFRLIQKRWRAVRTTCEKPPVT